MREVRQASGVGQIRLRQAHSMRFGGDHFFVLCPTSRPVLTCSHDELSELCAPPQACFYTQFGGSLT